MPTFEAVFDAVDGHMFHLEKIFCAEIPQLTLQGLWSIAKVEWLKFLFAQNPWTKASASSVARAVYLNGFGELEALVKVIAEEKLDQMIRCHSILSILFRPSPSWNKDLEELSGNSTLTKDVYLIVTAPTPLHHAVLRSRFNMWLSD